MFRTLFDSFFSGNDYKNFVFQISERRFVNKNLYSCEMNVLSLNSYSFGHLYSKNSPIILFFHSKLPREKNKNKNHVYCIGWLKKYGCVV